MERMLRLIFRILFPPKPKPRNITRHIPNDVKIAVSVWDGGRCRYCGSYQDLQFDHIYPWSMGGPSTADNIQLLCGKCNRRKSNR